MSRKKKSNRRKGRAQRKRTAPLRQRRVASQPSQPLDWPIPSAAQRNRKIERLMARGDKRSAAEHWELGRLFVYEGCIEEDDSRLDDGVEALMEAAAAEPPYPEAVLDLSWVLTLRGLSAMALPHAKKATELMPDRRDAWAFYGRACADRGRAEEATRALEMACAQPDATDGDRDLLAKLKAGEPTGQGGNVVSFFTWDMTALHLEFVKNQEAMKYQLFILRQLLDAEPEDEGLLYANALFRYKLGQLDGALPLAERLVRINQQHADSLTLIGLIHQKSGRLEDSTQCYQRAVEADINHVLANTNYAKQLLDMDEVEKAREHLGRALAVEPDYGTALHLYGNSVAMVEKDFELESTYHRRALEQEPQRPGFHLSLCMSLLQAGDFKALERAWRKGKRYISSLEDDAPFAKLIPVLLDPPYDPSLWDIILSVKDTLGGAAVRRAMDRMITGVPRHIPEEELPGAYADVGMLAGQCGLHDLSLGAFLKAEQIEGRGSLASLNVAVALNWDGRNTEAIARAREVDPSKQRAQTILGNILWDAGELSEAFECYQQAVKVDQGFLLPIQNGSEIGIRLRRWDEVSELLEALGHVEGQELACAVIRARLAAARGLPWDVVDVLEPAISAAAETDGTEHLSEVIRDLLNSDPTAEKVEAMLTDEAVETLLGQPDLIGGRDLTLFGDAQPLKEAWFLVAESLWACGHANRALAALHQGVSHRDIHPDGDWTVLQAECLRLLPDRETAQKTLAGMSPQPPPLISLALLALGAGETVEARARIEEATSLEVEDRIYHHPLGKTRALEEAVLSFVAVSADELEEAVSHGRKSAEIDPSSAFCSLALMTALEAQGEAEQALLIGHEALSAQPGDPELVRWCVEAHLDQDQIENADALLSEQRGFMEKRSANGMAAQLGETVAREKLAQLATPVALAPDIQAADWPWIDGLQPAARRWLQTAILHADRVKWLKLGLAFYLCKVAEMELVHRLILPFEKEVGRDRLGFDRRLRDLSDYLEEGRRPPSLGGISQALRVGAERGQHHDTQLLRRWRSFVRSRQWEGSRMLVSRNYLQNLEQLKNARNRVAHLGDLSEADFEGLYFFMVDDEGPGDFFRALGIHRQTP